MSLHVYVCVGSTLTSRATYRQCAVSAGSLPYLEQRILDVKICLIGWIVIVTRFVRNQ